jgi:adenine C2-methylase RlmN of 23S rRNA A2503 and tRNA A37
MVKARQLSPHSIFDENALLPFLAERGVKAIHAKNIWKHLIKTKATSIEDIDSVNAMPEGLAEQIKAEFTLETSRVKKVFRSTDGTTKLLVELQDGLTVETVIIP